MEFTCGIFLILLVSVRSASRDLTNPCDRMQLVKKFTVSPDRDVTIFIDQTYFYINCSRRGVTNVPDMLSSQVEFLDLSFNLIRNVKVGDFSRYVRLNVLLLNYNCPGSSTRPTAEAACHGDLYIEPGALETLRTLRYLDISRNYLREFPLHLPPSISVLDISETQLGDVTEQLRDELPNLTTLLARINCLKRFLQTACPRNFTISSGLASSLKTLDLSLNEWQEIPSYLFGSNLTTLILWGNPIGKILKENFANATGLKEIMASQICKVSWKPLILESGALDPLTDLRYLDLSNNLISYIPHGFFMHTTKLEYLDLSVNCLQKVVFHPTFLTNLHQLKYLDLSVNAVCYSLVVKKLQLGFEYSNLKSLEYLMLGFVPSLNFRQLIGFSTKIKSIDSNSFLALSGLNVSVINLAACSLQYIDGETFKNMTNLKSLYLSYNNINRKRTNAEIHNKKMKPQFLSYDAGMDLYKKKREAYYVITGVLPKYEASNHVIDYSHSEITSTSKNEVVFLEDVVDLDLSYNQIKFIMKNDFERLRNLSYLNLDYNPLQGVDPLAFLNLYSLKGLSFVETNLYSVKNFTFLSKFSREAKIYLTWKSKGNEVMVILSEYREYAVVKKFHSITYADLSSNSFAKAIAADYDVFNLFPSLVGLSLKSCDIIDDVSTNLFAGLCQLKTLDLSHNLFHQLPTALLQNLSTLIEIDLSYNHITVLTVSFFANRTALERLSISNNKISNIESGSFKQIRLRHLDLSNNYIQLLGADIISRVLLESLIYLDVRWNEIDCSCHVWETFYLWYISDESLAITLPGFMPTCTTEIDEYFGGCVACQSPRARRGRSVTRYGYNTSCERNSMLAYAISFTAFIVAFLLCGTIGNSKRFTRFVFRKINDQFRVQSIQEDDASRKNDEKTNRFHSFVFYDHENPQVGDWVDFRLVPEIKSGKPSIKLDVIGRDDACGYAGGQQVLRRAMRCHKTILILSEDFCDTPVCRFLITALQELQYSGGEDRLILITWYGDRAPRVPELIQRTMNRRRHCFLRFDHANDDEVLFFEILRTRLVTSNNELSLKL